LDAAFGRIWHDTTPVVHGAGRVVIDVLTNRLKGFLVLLGLGLLVVMLFFVGIALSIVRAWATAHRLWLEEWDSLQTPATALINALVFSTLYKVLPRPKVRWTHALAGGVFAASIWEIGRLLLGYVVTKANYSTYGVIGAFLAMMVWVYYASSLLFLGAQFVQVLGHRQDDDGDSPSNPAPPAAAPDG
jgi:membrane protein